MADGADEDIQVRRQLREAVQFFPGHGRSLEPQNFPTGLVCGQDAFVLVQRQNAGREVAQHGFKQLALRLQVCPTAFSRFAGRSQCLCHVVEGTHQEADLVFRPGRDFLVEFTLGKPVRGQR